MTKPDPFNVTLKIEIERQKKIENTIENPGMNKLCKKWKENFGDQKR